MWRPCAHQSICAQRYCRARSSGAGHRYVTSPARARARACKAQSLQQSINPPPASPVSNDRIGDNQRFEWIHLKSLPQSLKRYNVQELSLSSISLIQMRSIDSDQSLRSALQPMDMDDDVIDYALYRARLSFTTLSTFVYQSSLSDMEKSRIPVEVESLRAIVERFDLVVDARAYESIIELCNRAEIFKLIVVIYQESLAANLTKCTTQTLLFILHAVTRLSDVESYASLIPQIVTSLRALDVITYYCAIAALMGHTRSRSRISIDQLWHTVKEGKYFTVSRNLDSKHPLTLDIDITPSTATPAHSYAALFLSLFLASESRPARIRLISPLAAAGINTIDSLNENNQVLEEMHALVRHFVPKTAVITLSAPESPSSLIVEFHPSFTFVAPRPNFLPLSQLQLTHWTDDYRFEWQDVLRKWETEHELEEVSAAQTASQSTKSAPQTIATHAYAPKAAAVTLPAEHNHEHIVESVDDEYIDTLDDEYNAVDRDNIHHTMLNELIAVTPSKSSIARSLNALKTLSSVIELALPGCVVTAHGSFATGLAVKGSDIDVVVFIRPGHRSSKNSSKSRGSPLVYLDEVDMDYYADVSEGESRSLFFPLLRKLRQTPHYHNVQMINARVPIIKLFDRRHSQHFDICINQVDSINGFRLISDMQLRHGEEFSQSVIAMKQFLKARDMHEKFTGGLSSFTLSCLVAFHLNQKASINQSIIQSNKNSKSIDHSTNQPFSLVNSLAQFLTYYGLELDHKTNSLCLSRGLSKKQSTNRQSFDQLSFIHPFNRALNLGDRTLFTQIKREFARYAKSINHILSLERKGQLVDCQSFVKQFFYNQKENDWSRVLFQDKSISQSINQPTHQSISQSADQSIDQPIDQPIDQSVSTKSINQSTKQRVPIRPLPTRQRFEWPTMQHND